MVDYSKFDALARELEDSEEEEDDYMDEDMEEHERQQQQQQQPPAPEPAAGQPRVTRLDGKTSVTIGKDGGITFGQKGQQQQHVPPPAPAAQAAPQRPVAAISAPAAAAAPAPTPPASVAFTRNGGVTAGRFYWSQTRDTVTVHFIVDAAVRGKDVGVALKEHSLSVKVKGAELCQEAMQYSSVAESGERTDDVEAEDIDWELLTHADERLLRVTFRKLNPPGTVAWWTRIFPSDEAIPIESIKDRSLDKAQESKKVWDEAHRLFQEKVKARRPIGIDM